MSKVKKTMYYALFFMVLCTISTLYYFNKYHIKNDNVSIQSNLKDWLNRGSVEKNSPDVLDVVRLDHSNSYIVLFQLEKNNIGYAQLIKGWNGKFRIEQAGYGTNKVSFADLKTNEGIYEVVVGYNENLKIDHMLVKLQNEEYSFTTDVSKDKEFLRYEKLPSELKETFPANITFFDQNNNEIY